MSVFQDSRSSITEQSILQQIKPCYRHFVNILISELGIQDGGLKNITTVESRTRNTKTSSKSELEHNCQGEDNAAVSSDANTNVSNPVLLQVITGITDNI